MEHTRLCIKFQALVLAVAEPSDSDTREWIIYIQPFAFLRVLVNIPYLYSYEGYCNNSALCIVKHVIPCMYCQWCKFASDWSIIKVTWKVVCLLSFHWWDFPENSCCCLHAHATNCESFFVINQQLRALYLQNSVSFLLYLGFQWSDCPIIHTSRFPHMHYIWCKCGHDCSIIKGTLLVVQNTF
jgi:hypothetical protein